MKRINCLPHLTLAIALLLVSLLLGATPTGKISGMVTDQKTGDPIVGASIMIKGTTMGAKTDTDGKFRIVSVAPGTYTLTVTAVGYIKVEVSDVKVEADQTTERNFQLVSAEVSIGKVQTIVGKRKDVDFNITGTVSIKTPESIRQAPVATVQDLLKNEMGVRSSSNGEVRFRGGRSAGSERKIDGINSPACIVPAPKCYPQVPQYPPANGGHRIVNGQAYDAMFFKNYGVNPFVDTEDDHLSTFAIDVDDASYILARNYLDRGEMPPDDAIRVEEFINHFNYHYDSPRRYPFSINLEGSPSRFGENNFLLRVGIKGRVIEPEDRRPANLVFVIDVSGSMAREDRLELVKKALTYLVDQLQPYDRIGIVVFDSNPRELLEPIQARHKGEILEIINSLRPGSATNAAGGIHLGLRMAQRNFEEGRINRIIVCSDGVANVGMTNPDQILDEIKQYTDRGISLSAVGFGMGNYNDVLLEKIGDKGNGHYAYVDDIEEARRVFVDNLTGNLQVIARDVKIQVDFNPNVVRSYRLIGYENRDVADNKFRDDKEAGGAIGAGHQVTALYEIKFHKGRPMSDIGTIFVRYKNPDNFNVSEVNRTVEQDVFQSRFEGSSPEFRLAAAAAEFAEILHKSYWARGSSLHDVVEMASRVAKEYRSSDVDEFVRMVKAAEQFQDTHAEE